MALVRRTQCRGADDFTRTSNGVQRTLVSARNSFDIYPSLNVLSIYMGNILHVMCVPSSVCVFDRRYVKPIIGCTIHRRAGCLYHMIPYRTAAAAVCFLYLQHLQSNRHYQVSISLTHIMLSSRTRACSSRSSPSTGKDFRPGLGGCSCRYGTNCRNFHRSSRLGREPAKQGASEERERNEPLSGPTTNGETPHPYIYTCTITSQRYWAILGARVARSSYHYILRILERTLHIYILTGGGDKAAPTRRSGASASSTTMYAR